MNHDYKLLSDSNLCKEMVIARIYTQERIKDALVLQRAAADDYFSYVVSILASREANNSILTLCSVKSANLTGGSCPVKDVRSFEKIVNTSKLLDSCSMVDPLKECCQPTCQPAIMEAALHISPKETRMLDSSIIAGILAGMIL